MFICTIYSNKKGETPIHCAAYNELDSGPLMELMMQVCTDDIRHQTLQLRDVDQVSLYRHMYMYMCIYRSDSVTVFYAQVVYSAYTPGYTCTHVPLQVVYLG